MSVIQNWMTIPIQKRANVGIFLCIIGIIITLMIVNGFFFHHKGFVKGFKEGYEKGYKAGVLSNPIQSSVPDTIYQIKWVNRYITTQKVVTRIDTVYVHGEPYEVAHMDTTVVGENYRIRTQTAYYGYLHKFDFTQDINVKDSVKTVYKTNYVNLPPVTKYKTNWTATWMGAIIGGCAGAWIDHKLHK